jgi:2-isopropylmalate synthase
MENQGFQFEGAEASFELLMLKAMGKLKHYFSVTAYRVIDTLRESDQEPVSEATIRVKVGGRIEHTASDGNGPVNALDSALRKALVSFYPQIGDVKLCDYKVRVLPASQGTDSVIRVLVESGDNESRWGTVGVSSNVIDASYQALADAFLYKLYKDNQ